MKLSPLLNGKYEIEQAIDVVMEIKKTRVNFLKVYRLVEEGINNTKYICKKKPKKKIFKNLIYDKKYIQRYYNSSLTQFYK